MPHLTGPINTTYFVNRINNLFCKDMKNIPLSDIYCPKYPSLKQLFRIMRISIFLLFFSVLGMMAKSGHSQNAQVTINRSNAQLETILNDIESQTDYLFLYRGDLDVTARKSIHVTNKPVAEVLTILLSNSLITYKIEGNHIVLTKKKEQEIHQNIISGIVTDVSGEPLVGVTIMIKGKDQGAVTDLNGKFSLSADAGDILVVRYIGYASQEIKVEKATRSLQITLGEDVRLLDEVVVVGFGTQKKVNLTGAVGVATAEDFESRPVTSATQALQGLVPGLDISTNTGELDKNMSINIRGAGTIGQGSSGSPLILIDGMEGDLNTINPQDIENISVLKDAAASSIYGSRAPFGVILVTTKNGHEGKIVINYNNSFRISNPINMPKMMDSYTFANFMNSASENQGQGPIFDTELMQKMLDFQAAGGSSTGGVSASSNGQWGKPEYDPFTTGYANTEWYSECYKTSVFSQEHNISISGGSQTIGYYASFNYLNQEGKLKAADDGLERYNVTAKFNALIAKWLRFNYSGRFTRNEVWRPTYFGDGFYDSFGRITWPNLPVYDENGYYTNNGAYNPLMNQAEGGDRKATTDRYYQQASLRIEPLKNWITNVELNYSIYNAFTKETSLPTYNHDVKGNVINTNGTSSLYQDYTKDNFLNINIFSEYSQSFKEYHNAKIMIGFQSEEMKREFSSTKKYGLAINDMPYFDATTGLDGTGKQKATEALGNAAEWATVGLFGRLNYDYDGKYLVEANLRYDGTSRFRRGSRWQLSPSFSLGWNMARESFFQSLSNTINTLKLRASYGELGNQNTTNWYPTYRSMTIKSSNGGWLQGGIKPNTSDIGDLISSTLTWEKVRSWNTGLDWGLLNNRLTGSFDYYIRYTDGMVGPAPELPGTLGIGAPSTNNCNLKTNGWELAVSWRDRLKSGLGYGINLLLSDAKTVVTSYPGNATKALDLNINNNNRTVTYVEGRELGEIWGFETIGIAKSDQEMEQHLANVGGQDALGTKWAAGDIMYKDLDGKPGITRGAQTLDDHGDLKVIGNSTPRYFFGIDLSADWKGFDLRCFFQGVLKRDYWGNGNFLGYLFGVQGDQGMWWTHGLQEHSDYFRAEAIGVEGHMIPANLDAYYPRPIFETMKNQYAQTRYLQDASYIRLKNLSIGYTLPATWMKKISLTKCRIFISGENLWTGTKLSSLFDPETISGGMGGNAYPLSKTWSFGLSLTL